MTMPYQAPAEAVFFMMPDGSKSSIQMKVGPDGQPVPLAVRTPQQLADWDAIQAARPPSPSEADAKLMKSGVKPLFDADAQTDDVTGANMLKDARFAAEATAGVVETIEPKSKAEWQARADALAKLAASLGLSLVLVRDDPLMGVPEHLEIRTPGSPFGYQAGKLTSLETSLSLLARERAQRDEQIRLFHAYQEQQRRETAERIANQPHNKLARLEAALLAQGISVEV
jgi:hypothetical protein